MEEQVVSFETAKLLDDDCFKLYAVNMFNKYYVKKDTRVRRLGGNFYNYKVGDLIDEEDYVDETCCSDHGINYKDLVYAPTQGLVLKYLRNTYNIWITISFGYGIEYNITVGKDNLPIHNKQNVIYTYRDGTYIDYEEAIENGIYNVLKWIKDEGYINKFQNS